MIAQADTTMIREATLEDFPGVAAMGQEFYARMNVPGVFDPDTFAANWDRTAQALVSVLFVAEREGRLEGGIGAVIVPDLCDGRLVAQEMFWFAREQAGAFVALRLLRAYHRWAKAHGVAETRLSHMLTDNNPEKHQQLYRIYEKLGYRPIEYNWIRRA